MDNQTFQRIKDLITQHQTIGVVVKPNPTLDEMAGGLGMYLVLEQMGKTASIASPTDTTVALSNLVGIQKVGKALGGTGTTGKGGNLTVSFPYKEGEIEKVSYTQENGFLNILVQAGQQGLSFSQQDVKFTQSSAGGGSMPTLLFAIGVPSLTDIASIVNPADTQNMTVVNIDNKEANTKYGDVVVVSTRFSSVSEQVADFLTLLEPQIELSKDTSQNLFDGIAFATKDYTSQNTSYLAFEMAGILMKKGATRYKVPGAVAPQGQPTSQYFPPIQNNPLQTPVAPQPMPMPQAPVQPVQEFTPSGQSVPPEAPASGPLGGATAQAFTPQPVVNPAPPQQFTPAPQASQPMNQPAGQSPLGGATDQAPADWLTPKVYKGSSIL